MHIVIRTIVFHYYITIITCFKVIFWSIQFISLLKFCNYVECNHIYYTHIGIIFFFISISHIILKLLNVLITILTINIYIYIYVYIYIFHFHYICSTFSIALVNGYSFTWIGFLGDLNKVAFRQVVQMLPLNSKASNVSYNLFLVTCSLHS